MTMNSADKPTDDEMRYKRSIRTKADVDRSQEDCGYDGPCMRHAQGHICTHHISPSTTIGDTHTNDIQTRKSALLS